MSIRRTFLNEGFFQYDESGWQLNQQELSHLSLLSRSRFGLLIQYQYADCEPHKSHKNLFWVSNTATGEPNTRQFSRCFAH